MTAPPRTAGLEAAARAAGIAPADLEEFFELLRFPSVSALPERRESVAACADWLAGLLRRWGLEAECVTAADGAPPVVVARSAPKPGLPAVLIYGHYDVQPAEPLELWESPPFEPHVRDGMVAARGATDNKGQTFSLLLGVKHLLAGGGGLPANVKIVLEGEEEVGSPHFGAFLERHAARLACDAALIADTSMVAPGWPALTLGLRGILCVEIAAKGPRRDLHSGMFGGPATNPALALCKALAGLTDDGGTIRIPGFYDDVRPVPEEELAHWRELPWDAAWFERTTGLRPVAGEPPSGCGREERSYSLLERLWARPTAEINGLTSGHQGDGSKTIIPARASAKLSFRLVPDQDAGRLAPVVTEWLRRAVEAQGVEAEAVFDHGGEPFHMPPDDPAVRAAAESLEAVFGRRPALVREGLSIPAALLLRRHLGAPVVLAGLGLPDCQAHAPNETFPLAHLGLGAAFLADFLRRAAARLQPRAG